MNKEIEIISILYKQVAVLEADVLINVMEWNSQSHKKGVPPTWLTDSDDYIIEPFVYNAEQLYIAVLAYIDRNNLAKVANEYYRLFGETFKRERVINEFASGYENDQYNLFIHNMNKFLKAIGIFEMSKMDIDDYGVMYLERILKNTATILHKKGIIPNSEPQIYKAVREIIEPIFPTTIDAKGGFVHTAKEYKPDILIPELRVAVEYKYADSEEKLKKSIAAISDDVNGYSNNPNYDRFYAVFYLSKDFWGEEKFNAVWREKGFPQNWKGVYKVGPSEK